VSGELFDGSNNSITKTINTHVGYRLKVKRAAGKTKNDIFNGKYKAHF